MAIQRGNAACIISQASRSVYLKILAYLKSKYWLANKMGWLLEHSIIEIIRAHAHHTSLA